MNDNQSKVALEWLIWEEETRQIRIEQAARSREAVLDGKLKVDGYYDPEKLEECFGRRNYAIPNIRYICGSECRRCKAFTTTTILTTFDRTFKSNFISVLPEFDITTDDCCNKIKHNETHVQFTPLRGNDLNLEELKVASHRLDHISKMAKDLKDTESVRTKILTNNYFVFIFCSVLKILAIYICYQLYKKLKNRYFRNCSNDSKCNAITNCLTFNIFKTSNRNKISPEISIELENKSTDNIESEETTLRRSTRLAKLKDRL
ncbi:hypothetical protein CBL_12136 [Carabus blaptoides fortunei]